MRCERKLDETGWPEALSRNLNSTCALHVASPSAHASQDALKNAPILIDTLSSRTPRKSLKIHAGDPARSLHFRRAPALHDSRATNRESHAKGPGSPARPARWGGRSLHFRRRSRIEESRPTEPRAANSLASASKHRMAVSWKPRIAPTPAVCVHALIR